MKKSFGLIPIALPKCLLMTVVLLSEVLIGCDQKPQDVEPAPTGQTGNTTAVAKRIPDEFLLTSLSTAPGREIAETKGGLSCQFFQYSGTGGGDYTDNFNQTLQRIVENGKKVGANAFVNANVSSSGFEIQGSKWHSSIVQICGDYVVLK